MNKVNEMKWFFFFFLIKWNETDLTDEKWENYIMNSFSYIFFFLFEWMREKSERKRNV